MYKVWVAIGVVLLLAIVGGTVWWLSAEKAQAPVTPEPSGGNHTEPQPNSGDNSNQPQNVQSGQIDVSITNYAYAPSSIKVKKGSKVVWTNNDTVGHNVVAAEANSTGGLPAEHALLSKGQTFEHTFNEVGKFGYLCAPHPFMKGSVEVVE